MSENWRPLAVHELPLDWLQWCLSAGFTELTIGSAEPHYDTHIQTMFAAMHRGGGVKTYLYVLSHSKGVWSVRPHVVTGTYSSLLEFETFCRIKRIEVICTRTNIAELLDV
jgi:hypothetical protein